MSDFDAMIVESANENREARDDGRLALWPELVKQLIDLQWSDHTSGGEDCSVFCCCPTCGREDFRGHNERCELAALLAKARELE